MEEKLEKIILGAVLFILLIFLNGCANHLSSTIVPEYRNRITPVSSIGVTGAGATLAFPAFLEKGYKVKDLGNETTTGMEMAGNEGISFVAIVGPAGTDGSWWDGFFDFSMRVTEVESGLVVWSAMAEYGQGGMCINQVKSTGNAMKDMVEDFSKYFPPE